MRFNMRIAVRVLVGAMLIAILGVGIWRIVDANERGGRHEAIGPNDKAAITTDQAIAAAQAAHPDVAVVRTALEKERGTLLYSVKLNNGDEVKVDAHTGQVLKTEREGDDDDD